jgi:hypothetical protein
MLYSETGLLKCYVTCNDSAYEHSGKTCDSVKEHKGQQTKNHEHKWVWAADKEAVIGPMGQ